MDETPMRQGAPGKWRTRWQALGAAAPVVMVNGTAFIGQFAFLQEHVHWILPGQVLIAVTFETVAVYLAWQAHMATMADDTSTRIKLGAYLFAVVMGCMNYSHYAAPHGHPTFMAVGMFLMSAISPLLWGIHTRRSSRSRLMALGLVEPHAVRLGANRWMWHAYRSVIVTWLATWDGENDPKRAIAMYESRKVLRQAIAAQAQGEPEHQPAPAVTAPAAPALPQGAPQLIPGTNLNGDVVRAIAPLAAAPALSAKHDIDPARIESAELYLAGLPLDKLPSERALGAMLCDENHDHRRQAQPLLKARRTAGNMLPGLSQLPGRPHLTSTNMIASPVSNLPGGNRDHG